MLLGALLLGLTLGGAVRLSYVLAADFPLNDGGLFYAMVEDLRAAGYALPLTTSYNAAAIPYAYPPLAFYLAAAITDLTGWPLLGLFRFQPLAINLLTIGAFGLLARALLPTTASAAVATVAFALLPRGFLWLIMGGGLTRSLGFLFAVLAIWQAHALYTRPSNRALALTTLCCAAAVLSHLEMAWFAAFSIALLWLCFSRQREGLLRSAIVVAGVLLFTAPWWVTILARHGPLVFLASGGSGLGIQGLVLLAPLILTQERTFPVLGALGLLGLLACLARRQWFLPAWLLAIFLLDPRAALTVATVPLALLIGLGVTTVLLPLLDGARPAALARPAAAGEADRAGDREWAIAAGHRAPGLLACLVLGYVVLHATLAAALEHRSLLAGLAPGERAVMHWIAEHTPPASQVLVVTGDAAWSVDRSSEWFPVLAGRRGGATVQGYEWVRALAFEHRVTLSERLQRCALRGVDCIEEWARESGVPFTHVYVPRRPPVGLALDDCCWSLRTQLGSDPRYTLLHEDSGHLVFSRSPNR